MLDLGATPALADELLPWTLAIHFKETAMSKAYDRPGCLVPFFSGFWG
jgi:hypothetical protein